MSKKEKSFNLILSIDDINLILKTLSEKPFCNVFELITKINNQINAQVKKK